MRSGRSNRFCFRTRCVDVMGPAFQGVREVALDASVFLVGASSVDPWLVSEWYRCGYRWNREIMGD